MNKLTKFSDIPKNITCCYRCDVDVASVDNSLTEYINKGLDLNPDFQRGYVWTEEQKTLYVEHCLRGGMSGRDIYFNHPGWMTSFEGDFVIVDGKQRLDALVAFLRDEVKAFGSFYSEYTDRMSRIDCRLTFHVNNLKTKKEVVEWYVQMNSGGTVHTKDELVQVPYPQGVGIVTDHTACS